MSNNVAESARRKPVTWKDETHDKIAVSMENVKQEVQSRDCKDVGAGQLRPSHRILHSIRVFICLYSLFCAS